MPVLTATANPGTASWATTITDLTSVSSAAAATATSDLTLSTGNSSAAASGDVVLQTGTVVTGQTKGTVRLADTTRPEGWNSLSPRFELKWVAGQRGKPGINGDIQNTKESIRMIADPDFEVVGTNSASAGTTFYAEGGLVVTTAGAQNDQEIVAPHLDANQSAWTQVTWGTDKEVKWECHIMTTTDIVGVIIWAGLKLTNTPVTTTDANQAFFRYESTVAGGSWQAIDSIANTDNAVDTGIDVAVSTEYHLEIVIDSSRIARFYINGVLVSTSAALTNTTDFIPYIGVAEANVGANAEAVRVFGQSISRVIG